MFQPNHASKVVGTSDLSCQLPRQSSLRNPSSAQSSQSADSAAQSQNTHQPTPFDRPHSSQNLAPTVAQDAIEHPFFLVGAERSGSTMLRLMLNQHPQLSWGVESDFIVSQMSDEGTLPALEDYYAWLEVNRIFQLCQFQVDRDLTYAELVKSFLSQQRDRTQKPLIGATVHHHFNRLRFLWPNARYIHLLRDARDVARSCVGMGWAGNVWRGVERWIEAENLWANLRPQIPADRRLEVTYEALIQDPIAQLTRICDFIGIPYDDAMLQYPTSTTYSFPDPQHISQWRQKLSPWEIQLIESRTASMLVERGYPLSNLSTPNPQPWQPFLTLEDWLMRRSFRLRRYGFGLLASDWLARNLGLESWQKHLQIQLNQVDNLHLK